MHSPFLLETKNSHSIYYIIYGLNLSYFAFFSSNFTSIYIHLKNYSKSTSFTFFILFIVDMFFIQTFRSHNMVPSLVYISIDKQLFRFVELCAVVINYITTPLSVPDCFCYIILYLQDTFNNNTQ